MRWISLACVLLGIAFFFVPVTQSRQKVGGNDGVNKESDKKEIKIPRAPVLKMVGTIEGQVAALDNGTIEIKVLFFETESWAGAKMTVGNMDDRPRRVKLSDDLAAGLRPVPRSYDITTRHDSYMYSCKEIKVGDIVSVKAIQIDGVETGDCIQILRRPGGKVPPDYKNRGGERAHHLQMQAWQDYEEKGTPLPEKFGGRDHEKRLDERMKVVRAVLLPAKK